MVLMQCELSGGLKIEAGNEFPFYDAHDLASYTLLSVSRVNKFEV